MNTKPVNAVILDLGNVVLEWNVEGILGSLDLGSDLTDILRKELFAHQDWLDLDHGKTSEAEVVRGICKRSALEAEVVESALVATKHSLKPFAESIRLMQEIADREIAMFCLSNMSCESWNHIRSMQLFEMFDGIVISGIEECMKPDEEIFHRTLDRYELEPSTTLFVDDSLPNIVTSRRLGINGFHFQGSEDCYAGVRNQVFGRDNSSSEQ